MPLGGINACKSTVKGWLHVEKAFVCPSVDLRLVGDGSVPGITKPIRH
jgi:hypothetical protein